MAELSFEKAMIKLEQIVQDLEKGELPLEKSLAKFEEGVKLSRFCSTKLDAIEKKVTLLMETEGGLIAEQPFDKKA
ncbi:MAG: exodeoxyribonuclease VII small subunit [Deltaproteobacteria bacterium]|nr:exodeoxyribonuclease VII small subunit [Deltaproteobacteria bacterium]MBW2591442.1 exodeoxyribonuclease VII small subunit [Deltaproteobacteria bacterium]